MILVTQRKLDSENQFLPLSSDLQMCCGTHLSLPQHHIHTYIIHIHNFNKKIVIALRFYVPNFSCCGLTPDMSSVLRKVYSGSQCVGTEFTPEKIRLLDTSPPALGE